MVGKTPAMQALYRLVAKVMNTDLPVLITGESGTGHEQESDRELLHDFRILDRARCLRECHGADLADLEGPARVLALGGARC
jgi:Response regulator containing CheY-like receiver, AAA-type ATPase, and DNA-binding domains